MLRLIGTICAPIGLDVLFTMIAAGSKALTTKGIECSRTRSQDPRFTIKTMSLSFLLRLIKPSDRLHR